MFLSQDGHLEGVVAALCIFSNVEAMLVLAPMSTWASVGGRNLCRTVPDMGSRCQGPPKDRRPSGLARLCPSTPRQAGTGCNARPGSPRDLRVRGDHSSCVVWVGRIPKKRQGNSLRVSAVGQPQDMSVYTGRLLVWLHHSPGSILLRACRIPRPRREQGVRPRRRKCVGELQWDLVQMSEPAQGQSGPHKRAGSHFRSSFQLPPTQQSSSRPCRLPGIPRWGTRFPASVWPSLAARWGVNQCTGELTHSLALSAF